MSGLTTRTGAPGERWLPLVLLAAIALVYGNALSGPFLFDDFGAIVENDHVRRIWPPWEAMGAPPQSTVSGRPIVSLSLAVNHAVGGLDVRGYHLLNIAIHALCALALSGVVRRTLLGPGICPGYRPLASALAFSCALIWALHPLCTETVDYVVQRTESMMGLFYLLTVYCAIRAHEQRHRGAWVVGAVVACALGMACKEVMVTAPLMVVLHDLAYRDGPVRTLLGRRWRLYAGLAATGILLVLLQGARSDTVGFSLGTSAWSYLENQCVIVVDYLRLAVWPDPLVFDYGYPRDLSFAEVAPHAVGLAVLFALAVAAYLRRSPIGFPALWFFVVLAPTSSIVPIVSEVGAERRMYLPLAGVVVLGVVGVYELARYVASPELSRPARWVGAGLVLAVACGLGWATVQRNEEYRDRVTIWQSAIAATPMNSRAHNGLGRAHHLLGGGDEAIGHYRRALELEWDSYQTHYNMGIALASRGRPEDAARHLGKAMDLQPSRREPPYQLALLLDGLGAGREAIPHFERALQLDPGFALAHNDLGSTLLDLGEVDAAIRHFRSALEARPRFDVAHFNLGVALGSRGRLEEAETHYREALEANPGFAMAHNNLGTVLISLGRPEEAREQFRRALAIEPDLAEAHTNLGLATP